MASRFAYSALAQTQIQAVQASGFSYLPSILLSGFMFPFDGMPRWAQILGEAVPLTNYIRATRDVLLRGEGPDVVFWHMLPVAAFTTACHATKATVGTAQARSARPGRTRRRRKPTARTMARAATATMTVSLVSAP